MRIGRREPENFTCVCASVAGTKVGGAAFGTHAHPRVPAHTCFLHTYAPRLQASTCFRRQSRASASSNTNRALRRCFTFASPGASIPARPSWWATHTRTT
eukprot:40712-Chlamydomonas_euryale.AAC.1